MKTILITGAAGGVGTFLRKEFKGKYKLRLSDIAPISDLAPDEEFIPADLTDLEAVKTATQGVDGIFHLGGYSVEGDWQTILDANIIGLRNLYEAAYQTDKYGMEITCIRIGNVAMEPADKRRLSIWVTPRDLAQLVSIGLEHPDIHYEIFYGMSDNRQAWWDNKNAYGFGYRPQDKNDGFIEEVMAAETPKPDGDPTEIYQGGTFVASESGGAPAKNR